MAVHNVMINQFSLREDPEGFALLLHLPWYRSLWLSTCDTIKVSLNGEEIPSCQLRFELGGCRYRVEELKNLWNTLWYLSDVARLIVKLDSPLARGEEHDIKMHAIFSLVYMQIKPGTYVPQVINMELRLPVLGPQDPTGPAPHREVREVATERVLADEPFKLGISLFSVGEEITAGNYTTETLLERIAEVGVGPGIEIVASQTMREYPVVTDEFERNWRSIFDRHGFEATSFGANLDMGRMRVRDMNEDEEFEFSEHMLRGAKKLGFPIVRIQSAKEGLLERLLPIAEKLELKLGYEIHAPYSPVTDNIMRIRETYDRLNSPLLGFVADFSSTMHSLSPPLLQTMRKMGLDKAAEAELQRIWAQKLPGHERQAEFIGYLNKRSINPGMFASFGFLAFNMHGHAPIEIWREIMPQIIHVHAKFYAIDEDGIEPAIDYRGLTREFVRGGFKGYMSSEWEGQAFLDVGEEDPVVLVKRQHNLIRLAMHEAMSEQV